ncbi:MAG: selenocysteine-specific translation elongation factor [Proteobacteria bacterium]|nr:selenocysteine-specific translation elongation factor [Pseudomonadota bacterium]MBU1736655.1 selenocysteine-specific translation elongation factor [Pseudomonadota bacterium]
MREVVLGTAGHVDHGKTSLVKALTGIDTDRLKEEKARGITIELGFAYLDLPCGHRLGIVDVPGHEKFVRNMVAGATGIDIVAFVIAADEGIMPQTSEHFEICQLLGVRRGVIVVTKKDMVEPEWLEMVQEEIREYFVGSFLEGAPLVAVSSVTGEGIDRVKEEIDRLVAASDFSEAFGPFRMPVDRVFSVKGFGVVVTGTSISGRLAVGDEVKFYPGGQAGRVRGIQVHSDDAKQVEAGKRTAINVQGVDRESVSRGNVLASAGCLDPSYIMDAEFIYLSSNPKELKNRSRVRIHIGTAEIMGRIVLLDDEKLAPGSVANVQLLFEEPASAWADDHYVVRSYSPVYTIGGGRIFNSRAFKKKRFREANQEIFRVYREGEIEDRILQHVREAGIAGLTPDDLSVRIGLFGKKMAKILDAPISARKLIMIDSDRKRMVEGGVYEEQLVKVCAIVEEFHRNNPLKPGIPKEELRNKLSANENLKLFHSLLNDLVRKGRLSQDEAVVKVAGHEVSTEGDTGELKETMAAFYLAAGLSAPTVKELREKFKGSSETLVKGVLDLLVREEVVCKISEDLFYHSQVINKIKEDLVKVIRENGEIDAQGFKNLTGLSRKFSIPLLEFFDRAKITLRVGDKRILRERQKQ